jgi:mannose-1-phosphate guanylyltransferase
MRYAMIMAGGSGKRLWPASRQNKPKQLIRLVDNQSLLELAVKRLDGLFPPERILVITSQGYVEQVAEILPLLPRENIIGEPEGRDTANTVALGAQLIAARDQDATMAVFTADHIIRPEDEFRRCVERACEAAESRPDSLVTFGVRPTYPHTGLGYIHCDGRIDEQTHRVAGFKEKPDHHTARHYVESGEYFWNSGMFVWKVGAILAAMQTYLPDSAAKLAEVGAAARAGRPIGPILARVYPQLHKISIDYAVMEKAPRVLMVDLTCQWLDVGSWPALADVANLDADGNAVIASKVALFDSTHNIIYAEDEHLVAVLGMDECIIVHTPAATLVCNKSDAQRLKELVDWIGEHFGPEYV